MRWIIFWRGRRWAVAVADWVAGVSGGGGDGGVRFWEGDCKNILVFDLGGGTLGGGMFDVSVLTINNSMFEVLLTNGDTHLGGEDFNQRIVEYFIKLIKKKYNRDIGKDKRAPGKLRREAKRAKKALSNQHQIRAEIGASPSPSSRLEKNDTAL